jgi:hypothetical protein
MMMRLFFLVVFSGWLTESPAQYNWKLQKEKEGIKIYVSDVAGRNFKAVKAECTLAGTYAKLVAILTNITHNSEWVYHSKTNTILSQANPLDITYYTETHLPWPLNNRDAVIHLRIRTDSLPRFLSISGKGEPGFIPAKQGKVRVPHYAASWRVTMPTPQTIHISYVVEVDPGGSIPSWLANMFVEKGPYESFKKLGAMLAK